MLVCEGQHKMQFFPPTYITSVGSVALYAPRSVFLHLRDPEKPGFETFPRAAWTPFIGQPRCAHFENPCQPSLWRGCGGYCSDGIVSGWCIVSKAS